MTAMGQGAAQPGKHGARERVPGEASGGPVTVCRRRGQDAAAWDRFVTEHPQGSPFHLCAWSEVLEDLMGQRPHALAAWRAGQLVGVLPLTLCPKPGGGANLISVPYAVYGGPLSLDLEVERALLAAAERLAREEAVGRLDLRCLAELETPPGTDWVRSDLYVTFRRKLPDKPEEVLAAAPKKARAEVRKARDRHALELCEGRWFASFTPTSTPWGHPACRLISSSACSIPSAPPPPCTSCATGEKPWRLSCPSFSRTPCWPTTRVPQRGPTAP